jgi:hypothetical protein
VCQDGRLALTDWDYAGPVLPEVELVVAAMSFADQADPTGSARAFVSAYRDAGGDAEPADSPGLAVEAVEVDWLLRNVEACVRADPDDDLESCHRTATDLIASYANGLAELRAWSELLAVVG